MIIDEIKNANVQAMKDKDQRARGGKVFLDPAERPLPYAV